jgi:hypothetical protein
VVGAGDLERDLQPGVPRTDDQDVPGACGWQVGGVAVGGAVQLGHLGGEPAGDGGDGGLLERSGGHDDLPGPQGALAGGDPEQALLCLEVLDPGVGHDREVEPVGVRLQVAGDLVLARVGPRRSGERHPGQR